MVVKRRVVTAVAEVPVLSDANAKIVALTDVNTRLFVEAVHCTKVHTTAIRLQITTYKLKSVDV